MYITVHTRSTKKFRGRRIGCFENDQLLVGAMTNHDRFPMLFTAIISNKTTTGSLSVDGNGSGSATSPASVVDDDNEEEDEEDDDGDREVAIVGETFGSAGDKGKGKAKVRRDPENGAAAAMSGETGGAAGGPREAMVGVRRDGRRNESNGDREGGVAEATGAVAAMDVDSAVSVGVSECTCVLCGEAPFYRALTISEDRRYDNDLGRAICNDVIGSDSPVMKRCEVR